MKNTTKNVKLTTLEIKFLNAMRTNEYNDAFDCGTWTFTAIDNSGMKKKQASGVIASLVKKGFIEAYVPVKKTEDDIEQVSLTDEGKNLFINADGEGETCPWGGPSLLRLDAAKDFIAEETESKEDTTMTKKTTTEETTAATTVEKKATKKATTKKVLLTTFTGMEIGEYEVTAETKAFITIVTKKGEQKFSTKDMKQTGCKNPKFANKIVLI